MYALIYDEHNLKKPQKKVLSVFDTREDADNALERRKNELGKTVYNCDTRIVWIEKHVKSGDNVGPGEYDTWRPGEKIPSGEMYPDSD